MAIFKSYVGLPRVNVPIKHHPTIEDTTFRYLFWWCETVKQTPKKGHLPTHVGPLECCGGRIILWIILEGWNIGEPWCDVFLWWDRSGGWEVWMEVDDWLFWQIGGLWWMLLRRSNICWLISTIFDRFLRLASRASCPNWPHMDQSRCNIDRHVCKL